MALNVGGVIFQIQADLADALGALDQTNEALAKTAKGSEAAAQGVESLATAVAGLEELLGVLAVGLGGLRLAGLAGDTARYAARVETLGIVLETVGKTAGYSKIELQGMEQGLMALGITTEVARTSIAQMIQAQMDLTKVTQLARGAQDAAVIANLDSSETFFRLQSAISNLDTLSLRYMGVVVSLTQAEQQYAMRVNKTTAQLTMKERQQALLEATLRRLTLLEGSYENAMESVGKQLTSMVRLEREAAKALGEQFLPVLRVKIGLLSEMLKWYAEAPDAVKQTTAAILTLVTVLGTVSAAMWIAAKAAQSLRAGIVALATAHPVLLAITLAIAGIATAWVVVMARQEAARKEFERTVRAAGAAREEVTKLRKLIDEYEKLSLRVKKTTEEKTRLAQVEAAIALLRPETIKFLQDENLELSEQLDLLKKLAEEREKEAKEREARSRVARARRLTEIQKQIKEERWALANWPGAPGRSYQEEQTAFEGFEKTPEEYRRRMEEEGGRIYRGHRKRIEEWERLLKERATLVGPLADQLWGVGKTGEDRLKAQALLQQEYLFQLEAFVRDTKEAARKETASKLEEFDKGTKELLAQVDAATEERLGRMNRESDEAKKILQSGEETKTEIIRVQGARRKRVEEELERGRASLVESYAARIVKVREREAELAARRLDIADRKWTEWRRKGESVLSFLRSVELRIIGMEYPGRADVLGELDRTIEFMKKYGRTVEDVNRVVDAFGNLHEAQLKRSREAVVGIDRDMGELREDYKDWQRESRREYRERLRRIEEDPSLSPGERAKQRASLFKEQKDEWRERGKDHTERLKELGEQRKQEVDTQEAIAEAGRKMRAEALEQERKLRKEGKERNAEIESALETALDLEKQINFQVGWRLAQETLVRDMLNDQNELMGMMAGTRRAMPHLGGFPEGGLKEALAGMFFGGGEGLGKGMGNIIDRVRGAIAEDKGVFGRLVVSFISTLTFLNTNIDLRLVLMENALAAVKAQANRAERIARQRKATKGVGGATK